METFYDDEEIKIPTVSGPVPEPIAAGRVQLNPPTSNNPVPRVKNNQKILLELTGGNSIKDRDGLDLVAVLDVSGSMGGEKLEKMKTAMYFVIKKLSPIDRLSIVTFSSEPHRAIKLRQISPDSQSELEDLVKRLEAGGGTNTFGGLKMGLRVLNDRRVTSGRSCGIILMSDGDQSIKYGDAATVRIGGNVPVHTFGFGKGMDPKVLDKIARNSTGGTFSDVRNMENLNQAFSLCLAGLLTVVANDLTLTIEQVDNKSTLEEVFVTGYPKTKDSATGSVTISFGSLYSKEVRKVLVEVLLPDAPKSRAPVNILNVKYTYKFQGKLFEATPTSVGVRRVEMPAGEQQEPQAIKDEVVRQKHTGNIKEASKLADEEKLEQARNKIDEACKELEDGNQNDALVKSLVAELQELKKLMRSQDIYNSVGRAFVYAVISSHERQRPSAKGDDVAKFIQYATPVALKLLDQSKNFDKNPNEEVKPLDQEIKEEIEANPSVKMSEDLAAQLEVALQALQKIANIVNNV